MKRTELISRVIEIWIDKLSKPSYDNGDSSTRGIPASLFATLNHKEVSFEQQCKFEKAFINKINQLKPGNRLVLDVDYHPNETLYDLLVESGISVVNAPWKSVMTIQCTNSNRLLVEYKFGYQKPWHKIEEDYE